VVLSRILPRRRTAALMHACIVLSLLAAIRTEDGPGPALGCASP